VPIAYDLAPSTARPGVSLIATARIDAYIARLPEWQRDNLTRFRERVHRVAPAVEEGWKWDVPVFLTGGRLVCAMAAFANHTKYNFFEGATLDHSGHLFNSGLDSKRSRSINLAQGESIDDAQLDRLIAEAFAVGAEAQGKAGRRGSRQA
jgi:hypothetical protein